ncbi:hypothetical protein LZ554_007940 [Drepanopeziza brunnea f. sp. 'monogermtubi']|nr:hypothetical protein LZ554_007940 [Drepanopeziza brunnea f. sp. 'monogermtubi']
MRLFITLIAVYAPALAAAAAAAASSSSLIDSTTIYIQPLAPTSSSPEPVPLAEIKYSLSTLSSEIVSYIPPDLDLLSATKLLRVGIFDPSTSTWKSSVSSTSAETFAKGYSPTIVVNLDRQGGVVGVSLKSGKIDAGATRDFGPRVRVVGMREGKMPDLNRPVVLSPEGKLAEPVVEKTLLQKYWWVGLGVLMLLVTSGGPADQLNIIRIDKLMDLVFENLSNVSHVSIPREASGRLNGRPPDPFPLHAFQLR